MHPGDPASYLLRKDFSGKQTDRRHPRPRSSKTIPDSLGVVLSAAANEGVERRVNPEYLRSILLLHASKRCFWLALCPLLFLLCFRARADSKLQPCCWDGADPQLEFCSDLKLGTERSHQRLEASVILLKKESKGKYVG